MSGGSYNYAFGQFEDECTDRMFDKEMNNMVEDLAVILKDVEWWQSDDTGEEDYRESVRKFKDKWFGNREGTNNMAIINILEDAIEEIKNL